jgi:hypothetical protein
MVGRFSDPSQTAPIRWIAMVTLVSAELKSRFDAHYNLGSRKSKPTQKGMSHSRGSLNSPRLPHVQQTNAKFGTSHHKGKVQKEKQEIYQRNRLQQKTPNGHRNSTTERSWNLQPFVKASIPQGNPGPNMRSSA